MNGTVSFEKWAIVACGTLEPELNYLKKSGFLNASKILFTAPGLHQLPEELEKQLVKQILKAKQFAGRIIVVFGGAFCYVNASKPSRTIDHIIAEQTEPGCSIIRTNIHNCVDLIADEKERNELAGGKQVWFHTPGWLKYREHVFKGWDKANVNEYFPQFSHGAVMLDSIGFFQQCLQENPEKILEFSDWLGLPIEPAEVSLNRLKKVMEASALCP